MAHMLVVLSQHLMSLLFVYVGCHRGKLLVLVKYRHCNNTKDYKQHAMITFQGWLVLIFL